MRRAAACYLLSALASYSFLYFALKYYTLTDPDFVSNYYFMYLQPLDFSVAAAPHIFRQLSATLTYLVHHTGIRYWGDMAFTSPGIDNQVVFAAIFVNWLSLVGAATIVAKIIERKGGGFVYSAIGAFLTLTSFHTMSSTLTPSTDGVSWLLFAGIYLAYTVRNRWMFVALMALSIFQREIISLIFCFIGVFTILTDKNKPGELFFLLVSMGCAVAYFFLRKYILDVHGLEEQLSFHQIALSLNRSYDFGDFIRQVILSQNVVFLSAIAMFALWLKQKSREPEFVSLLSAFLCLGVVLFLEGLGNNIGRVAGIMTPAFAASGAVALYKLRCLQTRDI